MQANNGFLKLNPRAEAAVCLVGVSKMYRLYDRPEDRLKNSLFWRLGKRYGREFWALRDVSLQIERGEMLGIIGRNGSGKSTLLQLIAGVLQPTSGEVTAHGRVAALLELGSGFSPEFTGRENVYLNGAILGISRAEMDARFDEIADFAEIGQFMDQPVKLYSSGMFLRLAFAVSTMVDADVLLIDEALAVGDVFFRQKCYQRLETLRQRGVTIVLASHAMPDVEQFCTRTALIDAGELRFLGDSVEAVRRYYLLQRSHEGLSARSSPGVADWPVLEAPADAAPQPAPEAFLDLSAVPQVTTGLARCRRVALCDAQGNPCSVFQQGQTARFYYEFELFQDIETPIGGVVITNDRNVTVHGKSTLEYGTPVPSSAPAGTVVRFWQDIELQVAAGEYTFEIGFSDLPRSDYERKHLYPHAELDAHINRLCLVPNVGQFAVVFRTQGAPVQLLHHGLCNLPGTCRVAVVPAQPPAAVAT